MPGIRTRIKDLGHAFNEFKSLNRTLIIRPGFFRVQGIDGKGRPWVYKHLYVTYSEALADCAEVRDGAAWVCQDIEYTYS